VKLHLHRCASCALSLSAPSLCRCTPVAMGKRANTKVATAQAPAKKTKVEVKVDPTFTSVCDALMEAEELPDRVRTMLVEMLPFSLKFASDERHELQAMAVDMTEATLSAKQSALQATVASEDGSLASLKASESQLGTAVGDAEVALAARKAVAQGKAGALAEATEGESASETVLAVKRLEHAASQATVATLQDEKSAIETAFAEHFKPIEEGEGKAHLKKLEPFLKQIEIESTLLTALPSTCGKSKEKRGSFDILVLQELAKSFSAKITVLGDSVVAAGPASEAREAGIQIAEKDHEAKVAAKALAAAESVAADTEHSDREAALGAAKKAVDDFQPQVEEMTGRLAAAKIALEEFEAGPLANFVALKTRVAALPAEEEAPAEAAGAEDAPTEVASAVATADVTLAEVTPAEVTAA